MMNIVTHEQLLAKPVCMMTGEELTLLLSNSGQGTSDWLSRATARVSAEVTPEYKGKRYVYGISGIAELFGCSIPTANRIKKSGVIDKAITQVGRKIVVDAEMAIELAKSPMASQASIP